MKKIIAICNKCLKIIICGKYIVMGGYTFCSKQCGEEFHKLPSKQFCISCLTETTEISNPNWSLVLRKIRHHSVGSELYMIFLSFGFSKGNCQKCGSYIVKLWLCFLGIPIYPLSRYRFLYTKKPHYVPGEPVIIPKISDILVRKMNN